MNRSVCLRRAKKLLSSLDDEFRQRHKVKARSGAGVCNLVLVDRPKIGSVPGRRMIVGHGRTWDSALLSMRRIAGV